MRFLIIHQYIVWYQSCWLIPLKTIQVEVWNFLIYHFIGGLQSTKLPPKCLSFMEIDFSFSERPSVFCLFIAYPFAYLDRLLKVKLLTDRKQLNLNLPVQIHKLNSFFCLRGIVCLFHALFHIFLFKKSRLPLRKLLRSFSW